MREDITAFQSNAGDEFPFFIQMTGISYCDGSYRIERRNSNIYVFEYIIRGKGTVIVNNETFTAAEGDIYILPKGSSHTYFSDSNDPWIKIWFNAYGPVIDLLMQTYRLNSIYHIRGLDIRDFFYKLLQIAQSHDEPVREIFNKTALVFHEILIKISGAVAASEPHVSAEALKLRDYLDKHIEEKVSICELSEAIYRSPSQTIRIFKREFGVTPYDYLLKKRIGTAKLLLLNTNLQVKEIAYKLCFADEHYFSNFFKEKTGQSPVEYKSKTGISEK